MAEDPSGGEKTEDASGKKLSKARDQGQVAKSMEAISVSVLLAGVVALYFFAPGIYKKSLAILDDSFRFDKVPVFTDTEVIHLLFHYAEMLFLILFPVFAFVFLAAFLSSVAQVGFHISWSVLQFKFSKLNPVSGLMGKFSLSSVMELLKSVFKLVIIFSVSYFVIRGEIVNILLLYDHDVAFILLYIMKIAYKIAIRVLLVMALLAILDYAYQKWKFAEDQKMTKQEVKDEHKQTEGDPKVKSRIRQIQMEAARQRMMAEVPEADVVVTNPTRLAVAVKYDGKVMDAPTVVAKGSGAVAANIRRIADESGVPLVEDKELARNLYSMVDVGQSVPEELFQAVAELLAYVYKLKGKKM
ncbi:FlhB2 [Desulfamplus magnetovallimortis]|uniref:Flagellar biosynthetic protein FlhB n=1 Tax=Desulfamplus magnetovallimortis TaxID=1246637 RepID=A0A1W1H9T4_9BACT|nr:flagellar biosynthesis protein FlhB [Desulfamplus magnetovallimortis]SLM29244.1 FlhB2 [Desulfamplus magnetovallimortis]